MEQPIKYWSYTEDYAARREEILAAIEDVLSSGRLILGPRVERFEGRFAAYCGVSHGVGVNSGTDALFLALKALGVGPGDEVLTVSNTAVPTVAAIRSTGATPIFTDIDPATYLMDASRMEERLTARTRCILPVHLFGQVADMEAILRVARARNIAVLEDCAQAAGATRNGRKAGSFGDIASFSFYPTKLLGGYGDGGMNVTASPEHAARLRFYGMEKSYYALEEGYNSRLDEIHAAILDLALDHLDRNIERRRALAERYAAGLHGVGDVQPPCTAEGNRHAYYVYTIRTARRDALKDYLAARGIGSQVNYPTPIHLMTGYAFLGGKPGDLPRTEAAAAHMLSLPMYPALPPADVDRAVECIRSFFG
jgi:aminotransferase EvaB